MARRTALEARHVARRAGPSRTPEPGRHERDGPQRDHQHAGDVDLRLGGVLREREPRGRNAPFGEPLRRHGLRDPRPLPSRDRGPRAALSALRTRHHPAGDCPSEACRGGGLAVRRSFRRSSRRSRLLSDLERAAAFRKGARLPGSRHPAASSSLRVQCGGVLSRKPWHRDGPGPGRPPRRCARLGHESRRPGLAGTCGPHPGLRPRGRLRQPRRHGEARPTHAAASRAPGRGAAVLANPCRRTDPPGRRSRDRRADRPPGDPLSRQSGRRPTLCPAL